RGVARHRHFKRYRHVPNHHARRVLSITDRRNHAATDDFATRMKAEESDDVAAFRTAPRREAVWQASLIIVDLKPPTALDSAVLFLTPIPQKVNCCVRSRHCFLRPHITSAGGGSASAWRVSRRGREAAAHPWPAACATTSPCAPHRALILMAFIITQ